MPPRKTDPGYPSGIYPPESGDILNETKDILQQVQSGALTVDEALLKLKLAPFEDLGYAKVDHHRALRQGAAEVIYGEGKTAEALGNTVERIYDVGVAGLHRLQARLPQIMEASVLIAIAGMEGALASVLGGLVDCPVIAVPTSVGYGANFGGLSALLSMLNSCASGVSVVNIDNGFGAGFLASRINHMGR